MIYVLCVALLDIRMLGSTQQNCVAERMTRIIVDKVRCLMISSRIHNSFWGENVNTTVYLINMSPSISRNFKTPFKIWSGTLPDLFDLRIFCCAAFAH